VNVKDTLVTPEFVIPTADPNQRFVLYEGAEWKTTLFASVSGHTSVFHLDYESIETFIKKDNIPVVAYPTYYLTNN